LYAEHALTEKGLSPPQAAVPLGCAVRRCLALAVVPTSCHVSWLVREQVHDEYAEGRSSMRFPLDVLHTIQAVAKQHERSLNWEVSWALRAYAERHKTERK